jgi:hypothetical protein
MNYGMIIIMDNILNCSLNEIIHKSSIRGQYYATFEAPNVKKTLIFKLHRDLQCKLELSGIRVWDSLMDP